MAKKISASAETYKERLLRNPAEACSITYSRVELELARQMTREFEVSETVDEERDSVRFECSVVVLTPEEYEELKEKAWRYDELG